MNIEKYKNWHEKHAGFYRKRPLLKKGLLFLDAFSVITVAFLYTLALILAFLKRQSWAEYKLVLFPLAGFLLASLLRLFIDKKRPYELGVTPLVEKPTKGNSFPSRHLTSAFLIGATLLNTFPILGGIVLFFGCCLGYTRCAIGVHFPVDVLAGAVLGGILGGLSFL